MTTRSKPIYDNWTTDLGPFFANVVGLKSEIQLLEFRRLRKTKICFLKNLRNPCNPS